MAPLPYMPYFSLGQGVFIFCLEVVTVLAAGQLIYYSRFRPAKLCVTSMSVSMTTFIGSMAVGAALGMP
jgi:hypothetical protein